MGKLNKKVIEETFKILRIYDENERKKILSEGKIDINNKNENLIQEVFLSNNTIPLKNNSGEDA